MSDITLINDSEQSSLVTNGLAKNGELYLKKAGSTDAGAIVVYDSGSWRTFANEASSVYSNTYSVNFDGTNDKVSIPYDASLDITGALSITAWVKFDSIGSFPMIYAKGKYSDDLAGYQFYVFSPGGQAQLVFYDGGSGGAPSYGSTSLSTGVWYHVAVTRSASRGITLYLNGSPDGTDTRTGSPSTGTLDINIGSDYGGNYLDGLIDEVAVFNSVLSASDISSIYNSGTPNDISSLSPVGYWRMGDNDGGTGTTITDQGSGGNDGTLTNGPTFSTDVPS